MQKTGTISGSDKKFGFFMTGVFAVFFLRFYIVGDETWTVVSGILLLSTLIVSLTRPSLLHPFNKAWYKLGFLLGKVTNPIVLGFLFFCIITPIAILTRLAGRDPLRLKKKDQKTYWIVRSMADLKPHTFKNQF